MKINSVKRKLICYIITTAIAIIVALLILYCALIKERPSFIGVPLILVCKEALMLLDPKRGDWYIPIPVVMSVILGFSEMVRTKLNKNYFTDKISECEDLSPEEKKYFYRYDDESYPRRYLVIGFVAIVSITMCAGQLWGFRYAPWAALAEFALVNIISLLMQHPLSSKAMEELEKKEKELEDALNARDELYERTLSPNKQVKKILSHNEGVLNSLKKKEADKYAEYKKECRKKINSKLTEATKEVSDNLDLAWDVRKDEFGFTLKDYAIIYLLNKDEWDSVMGKEFYGIAIDYNLNNFVYHSLIEKAAILRTVRKVQRGFTNRYSKESNKKYKAYIYFGIDRREGATREDTSRVLGAYRIIVKMIREVNKNGKTMPASKLNDYDKTICEFFEYMNIMLHCEIVIGLYLDRVCDWKEACRLKGHLDRMFGRTPEDQGSEDKTKRREKKKYQTETVETKIVNVLDRIGELYKPCPKFNFKSVAQLTEDEKYEYLESALENENDTVLSITRKGQSISSVDAFNYFLITRKEMKNPEKRKEFEKYRKQMARKHHPDAKKNEREAKLNAIWEVKYPEFNAMADLVIKIMDE